VVLKLIAYPANAKAGADGLTPFDELNEQFFPDGRWVAPVPGRLPPQHRYIIEVKEQSRQRKG